MKAEDLVLQEAIRSTADHERVWDEAHNNLDKCVSFSLITVDREGKAKSLAVTREVIGSTVLRGVAKCPEEGR